MLQKQGMAGQVGHAKKAKNEDDEDTPTFEDHLAGLDDENWGDDAPVLKICFGPPTAESKNLKNHVNFDVGDLFFRSPALWSSQNVFGPPTAGRAVVDIKDRDSWSLRQSVSLSN